MKASWALLKGALKAVNITVKVASRVKKTEVFKKGRSFAKQTNKKTLFFIMYERNMFFSLFLPRNYFLQC